MTELEQLRFSRLTLEVAHGIAQVTLSRPEALNALDLTMRDELATCFEAIGSSPDVSVVLITGAGEAFCAGGDVNEMNGKSTEQLHDAMRARSQRWFRAFWGLPQPTVAAVNGIAAGGGANLVLAADFAYASERARFGETFIRVGLIPDLGGMFLLPRVVGLRRAKELCLFGRVLSSQEMLSFGIVTRVVDHDRLVDTARAAARELADKPRHTLTVTKSILNRSFESSMEEIMLGELLGQSYIFATDDHRQALSAFLSKTDRSRPVSQAGGEK